MNHRPVDQDPDSRDRHPVGRSRHQLEGSAAAGEQLADSGRGGNVRGVTTLVGNSFFGAAMPLELKDYQSLNNLSTKRGKMDNGHLTADLDAQAEGSDRAIKEFDVGIIPLIWILIELDCPSTNPPLKLSGIQRQDFLP